MDHNTIVYNKYWTAECIKRLKKERDEVDRLRRNLSGIKNRVNPEYVADFNRIVCDVQDLERSLALTYSAMENYMYDMERAITRIAEQIENAERTAPKFLE